MPRNDPSDHFGLEIVPSKGLQMSDDSISSLFDRIVPTAGEKGVEVSRIAGALGRCDVDDKATTKFIKQKSFCPRMADSARLIAINTPKRKGLLVTHISLHKRGTQAVSCFCNAPREGGHQKPHPAVLMDHPSLLQFAQIGVFSMKSLNLFNAKHGNDPEVTRHTGSNRKACRKVVHGLLLEHRDAKELSEGDDHLIAKDLLGQWNLEKKRCKRCRDNKCAFPSHGTHPDEATKHLLGLKKNMHFWTSASNRHSLVCHPVSFHTDVFAKKQGDKLENKTCFALPQCASKCNVVPLGRGGAGPGCFVFASIDWEGVKVRRRRVCITATQDVARHVTSTFFHDWVHASAPQHTDALNEIEAEMAALWAAMSERCAINFVACCLSIACHEIVSLQEAAVSECCLISIACHDFAFSLARVVIKIA